MSDLDLASLRETLRSSMNPDKIIPKEVPKPLGIEPDWMKLTQMLLDIQLKQAEIHHDIKIILRDLGHREPE